MSTGGPGIAGVAAGIAAALLLSCVTGDSNLGEWEYDPSVIGRERREEPSRLPGVPMGDPGRDTQPPRILGPDRLDARGREGTAELRGRVDDASRISRVELDGREIAVDTNGRFRIRVPLRRDADAVVISAVDVWGNRAEKTVALLRDAAERTPPSADPAPSLPLAEPAVDSVRIDPARLRGLDLGSYHALVIGNNAYEYIPRLATAEADADAVAELLERRYGFGVTLLKNATRGEIFAGLEAATRSLTRRDNLLIYYAGHGYFDEATGSGYWLPVDASETSRANWVSNDDVNKSLRAIPAKHVMIVADSCYSGTLTRGLAIRMREVGYVERMVSKRARVAITSGGLEPVEDGGGSGHSVFAKAFLEALRKNEDLLDGMSLFARIRRPVVLESPQTPEYGDIRFTGHEGGDFLFVPKPLSAAIPPASAR